ncbi:MAG: type IV pilus biogenesis/stability protein PilW [Xanthomonadales bacterium]|nr:type IV pilus biogenesis/stability protein PilW [Xanthomonadales bacterium]
MKGFTDRPVGSVASWLLILACLGLVSCAGGGSRSALDEPTERRKSADINTQLAVGYLEKGDPETALEKISRALEQDSTSPTAHTVAGIVYEQIGQLDKAEDHYSTAVRLDPDDGDLLNNYGQILCTLGKFAESDEYFRRAVSQPFYRTPEVALTNSGACLELAGKADLAERRYRDALDNNETYPDALYRLSRSLCTRGDNFRARAFLQRYQSIAPDSPESLWLCYVIETRLGDQQAAGGCSQQLTSGYPESGYTKLLIEGSAGNDFCG